MYSISFSAANVQYTVYHNVARQFVHCCKGDAASQWEMAILGMSELCNPWTDWLKIWHVIMLRSWPRMPNFIKFGGTRASRQYGEMYTSYFIYYIYFLQEISREHPYVYKIVFKFKCIHRCWLKQLVSPSLNTTSLVHVRAFTYILSCVLAKWYLQF